MKLKYAIKEITIEEGRNLLLYENEFPSIHVYDYDSSIFEIKSLWGIDALCVRCGLYIFKVDKATYERAH